MGTTSLDAAELLHLALHASSNDQPDKAITHLKQLLEIEPKDAKATYLLGALHAEIGMHEQAKEELALAEQLDPSLVTATFQLGLLQLTSGQVEEADATWAKLDQLGEDHALVLFKCGMLHLVKDEFAECAAALEAGIERNTFNTDLNHDMERVLAEARNAIAGAPKTRKDSTEDADNSSNGHNMLISAYGHGDEDNA